MLPATDIVDIAPDDVLVRDDFTDSLRVPYSVAPRFSDVLRCPATTIRIPGAHQSIRPEPISCGSFLIAYRDSCHGICQDSRGGPMLARIRALGTFDGDVRRCIRAGRRLVFSQYAQGGPSSLLPRSRYEAPCMQTSKVFHQRRRYSTLLENENAFIASPT